MVLLEKTQFITSKGLLKASKACNLYIMGTNSISLGTKEDEHRYMKSCNRGSFGHRDPKKRSINGERRQTAEDIQKLVEIGWLIFVTKWASCKNVKGLIWPKSYPSRLYRFLIKGFTFSQQKQILILMKEEPVLRSNHETEALYLSKGHKVIWSGNSFSHNWDQQNCD
ncbi:hypothetical protein ACJW30_06G222400 [Castanea mollissima]